jgi:hypothetical protein
MNAADLSKICPPYTPNPESPISKLYASCENPRACKYKIDDEYDFKFCKFMCWHDSGICQNKEVMKDLILTELRKLLG